MNVKKIELPIFGTEIHILLNGSAQEYAMQKFNVELGSNHCPCTYTFSTKKKFITIVSIEDSHVPPFNERICIHESKHVLDGINKNIEETKVRTEKDALLLEYIACEMIEFVKKNRVKY